MKILANHDKTVVCVPGDLKAELAKSNRRALILPQELVNHFLNSPDFAGAMKSAEQLLTLLDKAPYLLEDMFPGWTFGDAASAERKLKELLRGHVAEKFISHPRRRKAPRVFSPVRDQ